MEDTQKRRSFRDTRSTPPTLGSSTPTEVLWGSGRETGVYTRSQTRPGSKVEGSTSVRPDWTPGHSGDPGGDTGP